MPIFLENPKCLECLLKLQHTFLPKLFFFQRVWGVYVIPVLVEFGGVGLFLCSKNGNSVEERVRM